MTEYIHSGIAGKINRIVKPHIGNILVTSEFGNAKESTLTEATLKAAVNDINRIKYAVTYKGEKATVDALPTTGNTKGDMWNVTENGHNYAWTGSEWDDLGGTAIKEENSDWTWDTTPIYIETLESTFVYVDDPPNTHWIPDSVWNQGRDTFMIEIKYGNIVSTGQLILSMQINDYWNYVAFPPNDQYRRYFRLIYTPYHGVARVETEKYGKRADGGWPVYEAYIGYFPEELSDGNGTVPLVKKVGLAGVSLPVGTTIKVYVPILNNNS